MSRHGQQSAAGGLPRSRHEQPSAAERMLQSRPPSALERMLQARPPSATECPPRSRRPMIDMHEELKAEIYRQGGDPVPSGVEPPPPLIPPPEVVGFEDIELYFDSRNRGMSDLSAGELRWDVPSINSNNDIKGCVQMQLSEFYFPHIYRPTTAPDFFYEQRVFMEFLGSPTTQAVLAGSLGRFHFEFKVENMTGQAVRLVPLKKSFYFQRPITSITEFYVRFMVPQKSGQLLARVPLPQETVPITLTLIAGLGTNPIRFTMSDTSIIGQVGAIPQVAIFITGFASPDAVVNAAVNNQQGLFVTNIISATVFEVAGINASALGALYTATLYVPKNRIAMPVRFTCVRGVATNNVMAIHE